MGAWGYGIFDNDLSMDVRIIFEESVESGETVETATGRVLLAFREEMKDPDQMVDIFLPLAILQLEVDALDPGLRQVVLKMLDDESILVIWAEAGQEAYVQRKAALQEAKQRLQGRSD